MFSSKEYVYMLHVTVNELPVGSMYQNKFRNFTFFSFFFGNIVDKYRLWYDMYSINDHV